MKRSLIVWPGLAAMLVALMSSFSIVQEITQCIGPDTESLAIATQPSFDFAVATISDIEIFSRGEHGRRAMLLPQRVADVMGIQSNGLVASVNPATHDVASTGQLASRRIAGMILPPWGVVIDTSANLPAAPTPKEVVVLTAPASAMPDSNRELAKPDFSDQRSKPKASDLMVKSVAENRHATFSVVGWPATGQLNTQLQNLALLASGRGSRHRDQLVSTSVATGKVDRWATDVSIALQQLQSLPRLGDDQAKVLIERLERLATEGSSDAEKLSDRELQLQWLQASHGVSRRVAVWKPVWLLVNQNDSLANRSTFAIAMKPAGSETVHSAIRRVRTILPQTGDADGWDRFLLLSRIASSADADDANRRTAVAQQFLSRLQRRDLHPLHQEWLKRDAIESLRIAILPWAGGIVEYSNLLSRIEHQESNAANNGSAEIAEALQLLKFAANPRAAEVADSLDIHYRNANLRVAISQSMLQRMVPDVPSQSVPIRTQVQGSRVTGTSDIESNLKILLVPSADRWSLQLQAIGQVHTRATGVRGPVSVHTQGKSEFVTTTPIQITPQGIEIGESVASVHGRTRLRGIRTDYDRWPLVGDLIRGAAARRFDSLSSQSSQQSNRKIAAEIETQVDTEVNQRLGDAAERLSKAVLGPLSRLQLDPTVAELKTTEDRLIARYRLAGHDQLAAFTPRPRALSSSMVSVQVHQSAINNMLERLVPTSQPMMIRDAIASAMNRFGNNGMSIPDDIPSDVSVQFAPTRPITVEFKEEVLWVTLRVVRLRRGDRLNLTKFIVRAAYRPEIKGMDVRLVRDGHLRISGPGMSMRERLPIRAIFNKVLSSNRAIPLTFPAMTNHIAIKGLAVSQLEMRDGWIAMAITEEPADRVATALP